MVCYPLVANVEMGPMAGRLSRNEQKGVMFSIMVYVAALTVLAIAGCVQVILNRKISPISISVVFLFNTGATLLAFTLHVYAWCSHMFLNVLHPWLNMGLLEIGMGFGHPYLNGICGHGYSFFVLSFVVVSLFVTLLPFFRLPFLFLYSLSFVIFFPSISVLSWFFFLCLYSYFEILVMICGELDMDSYNDCY